MNIFTINCAIQGQIRPLVFHAKNSLLPHIFVYDQRQWVGTISKGTDQKYRLLSASEHSISLKELAKIGAQIDQLERNKGNARTRPLRTQTFQVSMV